MPLKLLQVLIQRCVFFTSTAFLLLNAQDPTGTLEGHIADPSAAAISNVEVTARNAQTGLTRTVRSTREGSFHFSNLPTGEYSLTVNASGFAPFSISPIHIDIG